MTSQSDRTFRFSLGNNVYLVSKPFGDCLLIHVRLYENVNVPTKKGLALTLSRWKTLTQVFDDVDSHLQRGDTTIFDRHLGGNYYVSVKDDRIDLRKWYMADDGDLRATRKGINLSCEQWHELKENARELNRLLCEELDRVVECFHQNQETFYDCAECCPNGALA
ncbi:hypothetical protein BOW31_12665 [Solemya velum gill symbiont]|uniref:transcriptional coactivator p15/PC4 family protein n=1 Tax=Solemya velum gill symbiont TaxID=2340 RepID=UPI0009961D5F|nr:hypothetical protein BOW31_12665 [Solemya velum gill symbiont]